MAALVWDKVGERFYETGVDHGVLYLPNVSGVYDTGFAWNGLTTVTETPSGAEANPQYADNIKYLNLVSAEELGMTIEAFTYPNEFAQCDGSVSPTPGVSIGQQGRRLFGLSYRSKVGNDLGGSDLGYKIHMVYGCQASPSERAFTTVNDSPEPIAFSWDISTTGIAVPGYKPSSLLTINSTLVDPTKLASLEQLLYGSAGVEPALPTPAEVLAVFGTTTLIPVVTAPTYVPATKVITIPATTGVVYQVDGVTKSAGPMAAITKDTVVKAKPATGYRFPDVTDDDWFFSFT